MSVFLPVSGWLVGSLASSLGRTWLICLVGWLAQVYSGHETVIGNVCFSICLCTRRYCFLFQLPWPLQIYIFFYSYRRFVLSSESGCRNQLGFRFIFVKFQTPKSSTLIALMDLRVWITRHVVNSLADHSAAVLCHTLCAVRTTSTAALLDIGITTPQLSCYLKCHVGGMWLSYIVT